MSVIEETQSAFSSMIDDLENECYLKPQFTSYFKEEVKTRIEEFSNWFDSTARLYLLRCGPQETEVLLYLLFNLDKKIKDSISEINNSVSKNVQSYNCICGEKVETPPWHNVWRSLQNHPHFEENFSYKIQQEPELPESGETSTTESTIDLSEDFSSVALTPPPSLTPQRRNLNDFRFNFVITYDSRVEEYFYPDAVINAARKRDRVVEYTVQRSGVNRGVCLLCPCNLTFKGRVFKVTPFVVKNHAAGQKHLKSATSIPHMNALKRYHDFWKSQEGCVQAHQAYFLPEPENINSSACQLCPENVPYPHIVDHIHGPAHKGKVLKIFHAPEGKLTDYYLLDMQVRVYDVIVNSKDNKKEDKGKSGKKEANGPAPQACSIIKHVVFPHEVNLPPRYSEHLRFLTKTDNIIHCKLCNTSFIDDFICIRRHVIYPMHKEKCELTYPKFNFFCEICSLNIKDEEAWLEHFAKGPNRHDSIPKARMLNAAESECKTCMLVIFGDDVSINRHIATRCGRSGKVKEVRLPFSVKKLLRTRLFIEDEGRRLELEATHVLRSQKRMTDCCRELEQALALVYPNSKAYPFGSRVSGLGNDHSDLDVFMDVGDMYLGEKDQDSASQEHLVKKATKILKSFKDYFSHVLPIPSARTPIVKLHDIYSALDCDISFRHGLGVENTKFLRFCIDLQPITQRCILFLKKWSECCNLNEHITNYGLAVMAVFFLQTGGHLPSVKTVREHNFTPALVIDGWETLNYTVPLERMQELVTPYNGDVRQLLHDFFLYFSQFDYANQVVCPLLGTTIPKFSFNENPTENLPSEMKSYIERIQTENGEQFRGLTPFCIQDPFDLSHNLTKACQPGTINKLKSFCTLTYQFLDSID